MATERQIAANRRNALKSCGPKSTEQTRLNATRHALCATLPEAEARLSPEFEERRALRAAESPPPDEGARHALDRVVAASLRIKRCEQAIEGLIADDRLRAELAWDEDRAAEAAVVFGRLSKHPLQVTKQLQTTLAGAELLMEAWLGLTAILESGRDWTEVEASMALDLLGVDPDLRSIRTPIDPIDGSDPIAFRLALAKDRFESLDLLSKDALIPLDEVDRQRALAGDLAFHSKAMQRLLRYERDAWRRYREATRDRDAEETPQLTHSPVRPVAVPPKKSPTPPRSPALPSFEDRRDALLAELKPLRDAVVADLVAQGFEDEDAWIAELERRSSRSSRFAPLPDDYVPIAAATPATKRSQSGVEAIG